MEGSARYDAFVSYSGEEAATVLSLTNRLRNDGFEVWDYQRSSEVGAPLLQVIPEAVKASRKMILLLSTASAKSEWVKFEWQTILANDPNNTRRKLVPIRIDDHPIPDELARFVHVDWRTPNTSEYRKLVALLSDVLDRPIQPTSHDVEVRLSMAMSIDGHIDDSSPHPLILSTDSDALEVDKLRLWCDCILVGANTIRRDNPRLLTRNETHRRERRREGRPEDPAKVTITQSGNLDADTRFFSQGSAPKWVYAPRTLAAALQERLGEVAIVRGLEEPMTAKSVVEDLARNGYRRLMVEGGTTVASMFLAEGLVDEFRLAIAPFFIADAQAPRFVDSRRFFHDCEHPMRLDRVENKDGMAVLHYLLDRRDG